MPLFAHASALLLLALGSPSIGHCQKLAEMYKSQTIGVIDELRDLGISKVSCKILNDENSCLDLKVVKQDLEDGTIKFIEIDEFKRNGVSTRETAFYEPATNSIYLNRSVNHNPNIAGEVGLHEVFGVTGYAEPEFQKTLTSYILRKHIESDDDHSKRYGATILKNSNQGYSSTPLNEINSMLEIGGATVVGGGGSTRALEQRILLIDYLSGAPLVQGLRLKAAIVFARISIPIEVSDEVERVEYLLEPGSVWPRHIILPAAFTDMPPIRTKVALNRALEDVAFYFGSIEPSLIPDFAFDFEVYRCVELGKITHYKRFPVDPSVVHPRVYEVKYKKSWDACPGQNWELVDTRPLL